MEMPKNGPNEQPKVRQTGKIDKSQIVTYTKPRTAAEIERLRSLSLPQHGTNSPDGFMSLEDVAEFHAEVNERPFRPQPKSGGKK